MTREPSSAGVGARAVLVATSVVSYWLLFMAIHEFGHVLSAWLTGGHVARVVLSPLAFSRTDVMPNPHPLPVVWGGPLFGGLAPLVLWSVWRMAGIRGAKWAQGLAGFCLVANGLYLASGTVMLSGDTEDLIRLGMSRALLGLAGVPLAGVGLWLLHRLGPGLGTRGMSSDQTRRAAAISGVVMFAVVIVMLATSSSAPPMIDASPRR